MKKSGSDHLSAEEVTIEHGLVVQLVPLQHLVKNVNDWFEKFCHIEALVGQHGIQNLKDVFLKADCRLRLSVDELILGLQEVYNIRKDMA